MVSLPFDEMVTSCHIPPAMAPLHMGTSCLPRPSTLLSVNIIGLITLTIKLFISPTLINLSILILNGV